MQSTYKSLHPSQLSKSLGHDPMYALAHLSSLALHLANESLIASLIAESNTMMQKEEAIGTSQVRKESESCSFK